MPHLINLQRVIKPCRIFLQKIDTGNIPKQEGFQFFILTPVRRFYSFEKVMQGRIIVLMNIAGIQSHPVIHRTQGRIIFLAFSYQHGLPQVIDSRTIPQHEIRLSQCDMRVQSTELVVSLLISQLEKFFSVFYSLLVIRLMQVKETQFLQGSYIFRMALQYLFLLLNSRKNGFLRNNLN